MKKRGKICVMVKRLSLKGSFSLKISNYYNKEIKDSLFVKCVVPNTKTGDIYIKSKEGKFIVYISSSPLNTAQLVLKESPQKAEKFLKELRKEIFYRFEAERLLLVSYIKEGKIKQAQKNFLKLKIIKQKLSKVIKRDFHEMYLKKGFDEDYIMLSQRIYPKFLSDNQSKWYFLFPGVYKLSAKIDGFVEFSTKQRVKLINNLLKIDESEWVKFVVSGKNIPLNFYLAFSPKETLKWELTTIKLF
jgi:hypothetical protein